MWDKVFVKSLKTKSTYENPLVWLFVTPWTEDPDRLQAYWTTGLYYAAFFIFSPGENTGVGSHFFLHRIFPTQGSNPGVLHYRWILYHLNHQQRLLRVP